MKNVLRYSLPFMLIVSLAACGGGKEKGKVGDLKAKIEKLKGEQKKRTMN